MNSPPSALSSSSTSSLSSAFSAWDSIAAARQLVSLRSSPLFSNWCDDAKDFYTTEQKQPASDSAGAAAGAGVVLKTPEKGSLREAPKKRVSIRLDSANATPNKEKDKEMTDKKEETPNKEEEERLKAHMSRTNVVSALIGKKLLSGWALLAQQCPKVSCNCPLMRNKEGKYVCLACDSVYEPQAIDGNDSNTEGEKIKTNTLLHAITNSAPHSNHVQSTTPATNNAAANANARPQGSHPHSHSHSHSSGNAPSNSDSSLRTPPLSRPASLPSAAANPGAGPTSSNASSVSGSPHQTQRQSSINAKQRGGSAGSSSYSSVASSPPSSPGSISPNASLSFPGSPHQLKIRTESTDIVNDASESKERKRRPTHQDDHDESDDKVENLPDFRGNIVLSPAHSAASTLQPFTLSSSLSSSSTSPSISPSASAVVAPVIDTSMRLAEKLTAGWALLAQHCPICSTPLVRSKFNETWCVSCEALLVARNEYDPSRHGPILSTTVTPPSLASPVSKKSVRTPNPLPLRPSASEGALPEVEQGNPSARDSMSSSNSNNSSGSSSLSASAVSTPAATLTHLPSNAWEQRGSMADGQFSRLSVVSNAALPGNTPNRSRSGSMTVLPSAANLPLPPSSQTAVTPRSRSGSVNEPLTDGALGVLTVTELQSPGGSRFLEGNWRENNQVAETGSLRNRTVNRPPPLPSMKRFYSEQSPLTPPCTPYSASVQANANHQRPSTFSDAALLNALVNIAQRPPPSSPMATSVPGTPLLPPPPPPTPSGPGPIQVNRKGLGHMNSIDLSSILHHSSFSHLPSSSPSYPSTPAPTPLFTPSVSVSRGVSTSDSIPFANSITSPGNTLTINVPTSSPNQPLKTIVVGSTSPPAPSPQFDSAAYSTSSSSNTSSESQSLPPLDITVSNAVSAVAPYTAAAGEIFASTHEVLLAKLDTCRQLLQQVAPSLSNVTAFRELATTITAITQAIQAIQLTQTHRS